MSQNEPKLATRLWCMSAFNVFQPFVQPSSQSIRRAMVQPQVQIVSVYSLDPAFVFMQPVHILQVDLEHQHQLRLKVNQTKTS